MKLVVRDLSSGVLGFFRFPVALISTYAGFGLVGLTLSAMILGAERTSEISTIQTDLIIAGVVTVIAFFGAFMSFFVNYSPLKVNGDKVSVPALNNVRSVTEFLFLNFVFGYIYRRSFYIDEIRDVRNQYTMGGKIWEIVISGVRRNGRSFSQRVRFSNKQVRDEVRSTLRDVIDGRMGMDFSY
jgi:hypothetical protein